MNNRTDEWLGRVLGAWIDLVQRHASRVAASVLALTVGLGAYAVLTLRFNTDNVSLLDPELPFRKRYAAFTELFPILDNSLLVVVEGETPELTREATKNLAARLRERTDLFTDVFEPGGGEFFERHALLYLSPDELEELTDNIARMQPLLAELSRDGSMSNLTRLLRRGLEEIRAEEDAGAEWPAVLDRMSGAAMDIFEEYPVAVSWESMLLEGTSLDPTTRRVIVAEPVLDFAALLPAAEPIAAVRQAARTHGLAAAHGVRVRVTGNPALNHEELVGLAWDIGGAGVFCFALVAVVLYLALRSWRLVAAALATLLAGLIWTAAFAAVAVGSLNLLSICFAVLFIGLGVDYGIHLGMHYAERLRQGYSHAQALRDSGVLVGSSLVLCTLTTSLGFWVFVPTHYRGVAELGLISGTGVWISLVLTLTLFPALTSSWLRVDPARLRGELRFSTRLSAVLTRRRGMVAAGALLLGAGALALLPFSRFDSNVVLMRDPQTESVQAFSDLLAETGTSPWRVDIAARDLDAARRVAEETRRLDEVERAITLADFVPDRQEEKLEILADAAVLIDVPSAGRAGAGDRPSVEEQIEALRSLYEFLDNPALESRSTKLAASMRKLRNELGRLLDRVETESDPQAALTALEELLLGGLPEQLERLRTGLQATGVEIDDLPDDLVNRMLAPSGEARIQVFAREDLNDTERLRSFAESVRTVDPGVTGLAINILEFGHATVDSLIQALVSAVIVIALLLWLLWRRLSDMLLVLSTLLLGAVLTGASMVLLDIPYNFTNVVVLPLLLGIGVDSGIHLVHRSRSALEGGGGDLLSTTTARAVLFSAVTTITSFGSLSFSSHNGMSSLGKLLVLGMVIMLLCNLVVLPALIELRGSRRAQPRSA